MRILNIDNDKGFTNSDLAQVKKILKGTEFEVKRKSKTRFSVYCTRDVIVSTEGMFDYCHELISTNFKPSSENAKQHC